MIWTKGNTNGEWEVRQGTDGVFHTEMITYNPHDERLFQLAPRMAEALLTWYNAPYGDEASKEFLVLCKELHKLKHGEK